MDRKIFQKAKLATAIALVSTTTLLTGCLVEGNKETTTSTTVQEDASRLSITDQATPMAQILGIVQDTNGNAVSGAVVSIGSTSVTTDANGAYAISNVPVTGFTGNADAAAAESIQISIVASTSESETNYLSATVSVKPQASTIVQTVNGDTGNTEDALLAIITTDGLAVSAGIAVIPALESTVTGVLRDIETGLVVPNAVMGFEVLSVNNVEQQQQQNSNLVPGSHHDTGYGVGTYQIATDENGVFTIENLPVDTDFDVSVEGWLVDSLTGGNNGQGTDALFDTTPEVAVQNIGTLNVSKIISSDTVAPFVTSVNGVVVNGSIGKLNDDLTGAEGLVINFSEPLQDLIDDNSVFIFNETKKERVEVASIVLANNGLALTVTTASSIPSGDKFNIFLNTADFQDSSENILALDSVASFNGKATPEYDSAGGLTSLGTIKLSLETYADPITAAGAVVGLTQLTTDGGSTLYPTLLAFNGTFSDVDTGSLNLSDTTVEQLNSAEASARLTILSDAIYADAGIAASETPPLVVSTSVARIQFTLNDTTPSRRYLVSLTDANGAVKNLNTTEVVSGNVITSKINNGNAVELTVEDGFSGDIQLLLKDVAVNDAVVISSVTDYGTVDGETAPLVLTDSVAPTTVVQNNYGSNDEATSIVSVNYYGSGGELTSDEQAIIGSPLLNITPRMLVPQANETIALPIASIWNELKEDTVLEITSAVDAYDTAAFNAWTAAERSRSIGVALSEDVSLNSSLVNYSGSQALTFAAQNNVFLNDQNVGITEADLIKVTVPDIIALSQQDHDAVLDFTNAITDLSGNTAAEINKAKVVLQDRMPAMLVSAEYSGEQIVLTFNEAVTFEDGDTIQLGTNTTLTLDSENTALSVADTVMTINRAAWGGELNLAFTFNQGSYDHDNDNASDTPTPERGLTYVDFDDIEDAYGNTWADDNAGVNTPYIIIPDGIGEITASATSALVERTAGSAQTIVYSFSHPVDLGTPIDTNPVVISGADVGSILDLSSPQLPTQQIDLTPLTDESDPTSGTSITFNAERTKMTVNLFAVEDIPANDDIETHILSVNGPLSSLWTTGSVVAPDVSTVEAP